MECIPTRGAAERGYTQHTVRHLVISFDSVMASATPRTWGRSQDLKRRANFTP